MTCPESFSNRPPSVLTGCHVIIFLKEPDIAPDVGVADFLADRLDRISSVGQQRADTNLAIEKFCFSIFATLFAHSISQTAVKFNGSFYNI